MEETLKYFINNLSILENLQEGDKISINLNNEFAVDEPVMFQGIWRYFSNANRNDTIKGINKLLTDIETFINAVTCKEKESNKKNNFIIQQNKDKITEKTSIMFSMLSNKMTNSIKGLENLQKTYIDDKDIYKQIDKIINRNKIISQFINNLI